MYKIHTFFKSKNASKSATFDNLARLLHKHGKQKDDKNASELIGRHPGRCTGGRH